MNTAKSKIFWTETSGLGAENFIAFSALSKILPARL